MSTQSTQCTEGTESTAGLDTFPRPGFAQSPALARRAAPVPLTWSDGVPAIDHHSHAGYVRPGEYIHGYDGYEREYAMGHVEANMPHEAYAEFTRATSAGDTVSLAHLEADFGIERLIADSVLFQSTTVHAASLAEGAVALYGDRSREELAVAGADERRYDFAALYDRALVLSDTESVLTDLPRIDSTVWPHSRYKPIARIDPYLYPFGHPQFTERGADAPRFRRIFGTILGDLLGLGGLDELPATLGTYLEFVTASITRRRSEGFVGLKIASAYVRSLHFERTPRDVAEAAYRALRLARSEGSDLDPGTYKAVADHVVYAIAELAVQLELPLQIHTGMGHTEPGLKLAGANPVLLEQFLDTPALNRLKVILIHGGYPYGSTLAALSQARGNVFVDFSWMTYLHEHSLHRMLQDWLEMLPANKVIFGTDTGSPEFHVSGTRRGRVALDSALSAGRASALWSPRQAAWLAERVLHQNLRDVYGLGR